MKLAPGFFCLAHNFASGPWLTFLFDVFLFDRTSYSIYNGPIPQKTGFRTSMPIWAYSFFTRPGMLFIWGFFHFHRTRYAIYPGLIPFHRTLCNIYTFILGLFACQRTMFVIYVGLIFCHWNRHVIYVWLYLPQDKYVIYLGRISLPEDIGPISLLSYMSDLFFVMGSNSSFMQHYKILFF